MSSEHGQAYDTRKGAAELGASLREPHAEIQFDGRFGSIVCLGDINTNDFSPRNMVSDAFQTDRYSLFQASSCQRQSRIHRAFGEIYAKSAPLLARIP
jgi:hypothetical protein